VIVQRDARYLNWKFVEQPHVTYQGFAASENDSLRGYVITRSGTPPEARIGVIADLFTAPDDKEAISALLAHAVRHLRRAGAHYVIAATSLPGYLAHYLRLGFQETKQVVPMFRNQSMEHAPTRGWFLSMGDHDWDQFPLS
jgi:hypothetical protein